MAEQEEIFKNFQDMNVTDKDINILILGETGVGKSTFINSLANYLEYDSFEIAEKNKVRCLIPAKFIVTNENLEEKLVEIGKDSNENNTVYESATLATRSYVLNSQDKLERIRLIDTPGIGDVSGIDRDNENMENILSYISYIERLHAICFLLKPNNTRLTVMFHYCIKQLLSRLEKSASKNIIFLFTNTRSTFYKPGDTTTALRKILNDIKEKPPYTEIKFTKDNVFCLDNESFRYLVAVKNGIELGNKSSFVESWTHSVKECSRMIDFITGKGNSDLKITPHEVKDTVSVNEARKVILQLSQPLADIADLINDNITTLERHNKSLQTDNISIAQLQDKLYVPVVNLRCKELLQPTTVCTTYNCCELYMVHNIKKYHYKQRCHDPCYLRGVPKEQIGSPELVNCGAMENRKCKKCGCDFSTHMHIYYISETFEDRIDNEGVKAQIKDRETALRETKKIIDKVKAFKLEYEEEKDTIIKTMAKFAHFLQSNAISPYNDSYKAYVEYLIDREKSLGTDCDYTVLKHYNELLKRYEEEKRVLDEALSSNSGASTSITAGFVVDSVQTLFKLTHTGKKIQELYSKQSQNQRKEHKNTEIVLDGFRSWQKNKQDIQNKADVGKSRNTKKKKPKNKRNKSNSNNQQIFNMQGFGQHEQSHNSFTYQTLIPPLYHTYEKPHHLHWGNQNYQHENSQTEFSNFSLDQGLFANQGRQYGSVLRQPSHSQDYNNYVEPDKQIFFRNNLDKPPTNDNEATSTSRDSNFEEWYRSILGGNSLNLSKEKKTNPSLLLGQDDLSSDSNQGAYTESQSEDDTDDDETFKDFMKQNNLECLVKTPAKNSNSSSNEKNCSNSDWSTTKDDKKFSHELAKNMDFNKSNKPPSGKHKSFLSNIFGMR